MIVSYLERWKMLEAITGTTHPVANHTTEYSDILEQEPNQTEDIHYQYSEPASQRHLKELELFREFRRKPEVEDWVNIGTLVY